ncbi:MAG: acyltransferase [Anaerolineales bacterium]
MSDKTSLAERVPELDGMRGLAILMVLLYHILQRNPVAMTGPFFTRLSRFAEMGWAGVDLFFVLSGFLITSILLRTKKQPGYFQKFYARRILRIFPLYYSAITLLFIAMPLISPEQTEAARALWPWYFFYLQNWGNALSLIPTLFSIGITWSLAIEEQFYLFWPSIVYRLDNKKLGWLAGLLALFSLGLRLLIASRFRKLLDYNKFFYFATITRLDSLLLGALIALAFQSEAPKKWLRALAAPVLAVSLGLVIFFASRQPDSPLVDNYPMYTYGYSLIALASAALIVMLTSYRPQNFLRRLFRGAFLRFFGKYSYALYLLQTIPLLVFQRLFQNQTGFLNWMAYNSLVPLACVLLALLSWNLLETRVLALKKYFEYA